MRFTTYFGIRWKIITALLSAHFIGCGASEDSHQADGADDAGGDILDGVADSSDANAEGSLCSFGGLDFGECPEGLLCVTRSRTGGCEASYNGVCERRPTECPEPEPRDFVCRDVPGCIGVGGYESECIARSRGYALALAEWPCLGVECEVAENQTWCPPDVACISSESECDDGGSTSGTCQYAPTSCDPATPDDVRCACDGTRYDSECHARLAGYFGTLTVCEGSGP